MGYPPCPRLLSHWFSPKEIATKMAYWNAAHTIGGATIIVLCSYIMDFSGHNWRLCFFIPAGILIAVKLLNTLFN